MVNYSNSFEFFRFLFKKQLILNNINTMQAIIISLSCIIITYAQSVSLCKKLNSFNGCQTCTDRSFLFQDNVCRYTVEKQGCLIYGIGQGKVICAQCNGGYYLSNDTCKKSLPNCKYQKQAKCFHCQKQFKLVGNQCVSEVKTTVYPAHCISVDSSRKCSSCQKGYLLSKQKCVLSSLVCNTTQLFKGCLLISGGKCTTCMPNYMLVNGRCKQIVLPYCIQLNNSICSKCDLYYTLINGNCVNDYSKSLVNCLRSDSLKCIECIPGFTLSNSTCIKSNQQILVRNINSLIVYTLVFQKYYFNNWYKYCTSFQNGICKSCQKSYILNNNKQCVKDLSLLNKFSQISIKTSVILSPILSWWQFSPQQISNNQKQIWYQTSSNYSVTIWGLTILRKNSFSSSGIFLVYKNENGSWICYNRCQIKNLEWVNDKFQWGFYDSIRTSAIRIYFVRLIGNVSVQIESYYEDPLAIDSDLKSIWNSANLYQSGAVSQNFQYKLSTVPKNNGLVLSGLSNWYAGFQIQQPKVVRIKKIILQASDNNSWITSFVLKYSLDGVNFYCVDGCSRYQGLIQGDQPISIKIKNPVYCKILIVVPISYQNKPGLRFDFFYDSIVSLGGCERYFIDSKCAVCSKDYELSNGVCKIKFSQVKNCLTMNNNNGFCLQCLDGYYLNNLGQCPPKSAGCIYSGSVCTSCIQGYVFANNLCSINKQYLLRMSSIGIKLYSSIGTGSSPLFTDDCSGKGGWVPRISNSDQWTIMSTSETLKIYKITITSGSTSWLESFYLYYSMDMNIWTQYTSPMTFVANSQQNKGLIEIYLTPYITAKSIKIVPLTWGGKGINFNFEAYYYYHKSRGEYYDQNNLTFKSFNDLSDVFFSQKVVITEMNTRIGDNGCFTLPSSSGQYLQLSLDQFQDQIANVTTMYVRGSNLRKAWVSSLYLMISRNYGRTFSCYKDCTPIKTGLSGADDLKTFALEGLSNITDIKIFPVTWQNANSMRIQFAMM